MVASYGGIPLFMPSISILLRRYAVVFNASARYYFAIWLSFSTHRTIAHKVRLRRSALSFSSALYGTVNSWDIFSLSHNSDIFIFVFTAVVTSQVFDYDFSLRWYFFVKFFELRYDFIFVSYRTCIYFCILLYFSK
jgi:hypothetical protein